MSYFLQELIPTTGLIASYPCVDVTTATRLSAIADYSGNSKTLTAVGTGSDRPLGELASVRGRPTVLHAGESPLLNSPTPSPDVKAIWILTKYDLAANFGASFRGLVTGETTGNGLVGNTSNDTNFFNNLLSATYYKSGTTYAESAMAAPFTDFEVCRYVSPTALGWDGIQVGQQTSFTGRRWYGRWADLHLYSADNSAADVRKLKLYYDLKYYQWLRVGTTLEYPDPTMTGIYWRHFKAVNARDWAAITDTYEYEDGGRDFNRRTNTPPRIWQIDYTGLTFAQMEIFDTFADVVGIDRTFSFVDKWGISFTGVRIEKYESSHKDHKPHDNTVTLTLVLYP